jgi:hypothetical protein
LEKRAIGVADRDHDGPALPSMFDTESDRAFPIDEAGDVGRGLHVQAGD